MQFDKRAITCHFMSHWGVPSDIRPRKLAGVDDFAILEFAPRGTRTTWRYATNGMSAYAQKCADGQGKTRTEVFGATKSKVTWADELLAAVATYPRDYVTCLAEGDTIHVGQPIDRQHSPFTTLLLAPPGRGDPEAVGAIAQMSEVILVHQVVGILPLELAFAGRRGGKLLWNRLASGGEVLLDQERLSVI